MSGKGECEHRHSDTRRQYIYELETVLNRHGQLSMLQLEEHWVIAHSQDSTGGRSLINKTLEAVSLFWFFHQYQRMVKDD